jgi:hypothetical protein
MTAVPTHSIMNVGPYQIGSPSTPNGIQANILSKILSTSLQRIRSSKRGLFAEKWTISRIPGWSCLKVCSSLPAYVLVDEIYCLARILVGSLLIRDFRERATVYSALESNWIQCEIDDLKYLYRNRVVSVDG